MGNTIRVALPGYNALSETNLYRYSLYADSDNILIKELARGIGSIAFLSTATINHNLGYIPFYLVYCKVGTNLWRIVNAFDPVGSGWKVYTTTTQLLIYNGFSASFTDYRYYIFYDNLT